jgi:PAP2 superfamily
MSRVSADPAVVLNVSASPATRARVATAAELGLNRLAWCFISLQLALFAATCVLFQRFGLSIVWSSTAVYATALSMFALAWLCHFVWPGRPGEWIVAETLLIALLLLSLTYIVAPAQYAAVALKRPLIDASLAAADRVLGVHVPALAAWTREHSMISRVLTLAYITIGPQMFLPVIVLGLFKRERARLWEYCFNFHFCLVLTLLALAFFPAACAFNFYGFESTLDQTRFTTHFMRLRESSFSEIHYDKMEGLISMPSFHVAAGLMVTWAFRQHRIWMMCLVCLNVLMIAATFMSGAHYFIDVVATAALFVAGVVVYRLWGAGLVGGSAADGESQAERR